MKSRTPWAIGIVTILSGVVGVLAAQTPASPAFEVASIKRSARSDTAGGIRTLAGGRLQISNMGVRGLVGLAYPSYEQIGLPRWAQSDRYDVDAKGDPGAARAETIRMFRNLLIDRFGLKAHYEQRSKRVLALTVARPPRPDRLQPLGIDCDKRDEAEKDRPPTLPSTETGEMSPCFMVNSGFIVNSGGITMELFAQTLSGLMDEPVVDRTELQGYYKFVVKFSRTGPRIPPPSDEYPVIPTALREQLGLELKSIETKLDVLVIDAIQRPSEN